MSEECGHKSKEGFVCHRDKGHKDLHIHYGEVETLNNYESRFIIHEWDDNGSQVPFKEEGCAFPVRYDASMDEKRKIVSLCIMDAKKNLPEGAVFEIRTKMMPTKDINYDFGRRVMTEEQQIADWGIAWYWSNNQEGYCKMMDYEPLFQNDVDAIIEDEYMGCGLIARIKV